MTVKKRLVTALVALTIPAAMVNPIAAADKNVAKAQKEVTEEANTKNLDPALKSDAEDMEQALEVIESIPDDVLLKGDAATKEWLESNQKVNELNQEASVWGCCGYRGTDWRKLDCSWKAVKNQAPNQESRWCI